MGRRIKSFRNTYNRIHRIHRTQLTTHRVIYLMDILFGVSILCTAVPINFK